MLRLLYHVNVGPCESAMKELRREEQQALGPLVDSNHTHR